MNRFDFTQTGGFPLDQEVFGFQQENIHIASQAANLGGQLYILNGCDEVGDNIGNGYVVIDGETLPFVGGAKQPKAIIIEEREGLLYEDSVTRDVQITRYATFGENGVQEFLWANFKRNKGAGVLARIDALEADNLKLKLMAAPFLAGGGMVLWRKPFNEIPDGWQEVTDWRGRLPMGYDPNNYLFDEPGLDFGGATEKTLTKGNLPSDLSFSLPWAGSDSGTGAYDGGSGNAGSNNINLGGASQAFSLLNPYRVVVFIEPIPIV